MDDNNMKAQEIFDKVAKHLFTQGYQSSSEDDGRCLYRDGKGGSCAVGCLLSDSFYEKYLKKYEMVDGMDVYSLFEKFSSKLRHLTPHVLLLTRLQHVHDGIMAWVSTQGMRRALLEVVEMHNLDSSVLNNLSFINK